MSYIMHHHNLWSELQLQSDRRIQLHLTNSSQNYHLVLAEGFHLKIFSVSLCSSLPFWEKKPVKKGEGSLFFISYVSKLSFVIIIITIKPGFC